MGKPKACPPIQRTTDHRHLLLVAARDDLEALVDVAAAFPSDLAAGFGSFEKEAEDPAAKFGRSGSMEEFDANIRRLTLGGLLGCDFVPSARPRATVFSAFFGADLGKLQKAG